MSTNGKLFYFCFASNLWSKRMHIDVKSAVKYGNGLLKDWTLTFAGASKLWLGSMANIVPKTNGVVWGTVWTISDTELEIMDKQEVGYKRIEINVLVGEEVVKCDVYVQKGTHDDGFEFTTDETTPSLAYKTVILKGAIEQGLPEDYIQFLKSFKDNGNINAGPKDLNLTPIP
ncbi:unnamed protein product [Medioppia subpectinata]|uniref:gamma-glutamylcyclotransferase n=1 Tax=Medioppia subpectinata TaxID=1979941 RepID=A0A7R9KK56_9ACAR|nr:unnamed protein product [Medioppia subpectinata]CAG2103772.1 unnamed protein product [Medioppia subpectinata]